MVNGIAIPLTAEEIAEISALSPTQEEIDCQELQNAKNIKINQCQTYLQSTDWQAAAFIKYGRPIDANVSKNCLKAKQWKIEINACTTLEELNNINIDFNTDL